MPLRSSHVPKTRRIRHFAYQPRGAVGRLLPPDTGHLRGANALLIGNAIVEYEVLSRTVPTESVTIPLYGAMALAYPLDQLARILEGLLIDTLARDVQVRFHLRRYQEPLPRNDGGSGTAATAALFSGGVDSYAGILVAREQRDHVKGVYAAHRDQSHATQLVRQLAEHLEQRYGIPVVAVPAPPLRAEGYVQLRGFGYVLDAAYEALSDNADAIVVSECGPTMFQPHFGPFDAVTMTTHPQVMRAAQDVLAIVADRPVPIRVPFRHLTKAEVIHVSPDKDFRATHSCISQRFGRHDGTCYGCVIRRLAMIATGARDVEYDRNPIADATSRSGNLLSLLVFCQDVLTRYEDLPYFQKEPIETYGTASLFQRFALDNYSALHLLKRGHRPLQPVVRQLYEDTLGAIGRETLDDRIDELRSQRRDPPDILGTNADLPSSVVRPGEADCA